MKTSKAAKQIYFYLSASENPKKADVIFGFGHFDMGIPKRCVELYNAGFADKIIFSGGIGAGTADLSKPEAIAFREILHQMVPDFDIKNLLIEERSTNTGENCAYSKVLISRNSAFNFKTALLVANPSRQKRVYLTCLQHWPNLDFYNTPPESSFKKQEQLFASKGQKLQLQLIGEIERIIQYPKKGFMAFEQIPSEVYQSYLLLLKNSTQ